MNLSFTKNQNLILKTLFDNPEKSYYLRELGRTINKEPGVFQRDINKLVERNILTSEYKGKSRFFKLNKNHSLYKELKSIFFKTLGAEGKLRELLESFRSIKAAFIFGSYAQEREDSFSDIDLMIIGRLDEDHLITEISKLEKKLDREINYHIFSPDDWKNKVQEKDPFIKNIIAKEKIFLISDKNELSGIS